MQALLAAFGEMGLAATQRTADSVDPIAGVVTVEDRFLNRVDILLGIRGMDPEALSRTTVAPLLGSTVRVLGLEDFIATKLFAGAPRDLDDVRGALRAGWDSVDLALLRRVTARFGEEESKRLEQLLTEVSSG